MILMYFLKSAELESIVMNNVTYIDFRQNRCRNSEAEKRHNAPKINLTEPELEFEDIALHDRILDLMEDPNSVDTNFFYNFWEANSDIWQELISFDHEMDVRELDIQQLRYRVSVLFDFLGSLQLAAEAQALEEKSENE